MALVAVEFPKGPLPHFPFPKMSSKRLRHAQMRKAVARSKGNLKAEREACRDLVELLSRDGRAEEEWRECKDMAEVCNKMGDKKEEAMAHR